MERELLLLGLLRQETMHGYRLIEFIERDLEICTDLKKPTAYFLLDKMVKAGWVMQHQEQHGNRPPRRVYQLTAEGEAQYQRLLRQNLASYEMVKFGGDTGLIFAAELPREELLALLDQRRTALLAGLETAKAAPPHRGLSQLLIDHRVFHLESELRWLDRVLEQVEEQKVSS